MKPLYRKCVVALACLALSARLFYHLLHQNHMLTAAIEKGDTASALAALAAGADPNAHFVYENRPRDVMKVIHWVLRDQAIVWHDAPVLSEVFSNLQVSLVQALLERGADVNARDSRGNTALMCLANNQFSTVQSLPLLLQHGAKPSLKNKEGKTALQLAREAKHLAAARLLEQVDIKE